MSSIQITAPRIEQAEFVRNVLHATPEAGTSHEEMLKPEYWTHVAKQLKPGTIIQAVPEDGLWFAEFYVVAASRTWAKVSLLRFHELSEIATPDVVDKGAEYKVEWGGAVHKWRLVRLSDKQVIKKEMQSKEDAQLALVNLEKALTA